jgi:putative transposase
MPRATPGGIVYHVLNRANAGIIMFRSKSEYAAFEQALEEAHARVPVRLLAYCLMPDHWHLVIWPRRARELSEFMRWLTVTHTRRWHAQRHVSGSGHLYQGRYRSFPVEPGEPLVDVLRYIESNPKRDKRVTKAEAWPWSSLARRLKGDRRPRAGDAGGAAPDDTPAALLDEGPGALPRGWVAKVNAPLEPEVLKALRNSVQRGTPYGSAKWRARIVDKLGLEHTMRPRGRPRIHPLPEVQAAQGGAVKAPKRPDNKPNRPGPRPVIARRAASPVPQNSRQGSPKRKK